MSTLEDLPCVYCVVCGERAVRASPAQANCWRGHVVHVSGVQLLGGQQPPGGATQTDVAPAVPRGSWRDRPALL